MSQQNQVIFNGRYELHRRLGRGGMAEVYLARDLLLDRPVAVKVLFPALATDAGFVERFRREAQSAANLQHPNIVSVFDWGEANGTYFIVMEYVEGQTLAEMIHQEGRLHPDRAAEITHDIAAALGFAHRNRVVHRDVKPGNVLITRDGGVKVADFGIARALSDSTDQNLTKTGSVMGTATYFSPEQARGAPVDPRSDIYSLGVVLYEMITGRPPFGGDNAVAIAYKHVQENPLPPRQIDPSLPDTLEAITLKCLAKNPANRYPTAQDLRADLRRYLDGSRIMAEPVLSPPYDPGATQAMAPTAYDQTALVSGPVGYEPDEYDDDYDEYDDYEDEEPKRSKGFLVALVLLLLLLAGLLVLLAVNLTRSGSEAETATVPNVVGQPVAEATRAIEDAGFEVSTAYESSDQPADTVIRQDPPAGEEAEVGSTVTLTVSSGPEPVVVPDVRGMTVTEASQALSDANLLLGEQVQVESDEVEEGRIVEQDPAAGQQVPPGTAVTVQVSSGAGTVTVPDVTGRTEGEARATLEGAGFRVDVQTQASETEAGRVISTSPGPGSEVEPGSRVTIVVSSGPSQVTVPSVEGLSEENAIGQIEGAGLVASVNEEVVNNPGQDGRVLSQSPSAGERRNPGSTVTIVVGRFREPEGGPGGGG
jgi:beta-lactam-binding protein with PASTA domain/serine/threonine protein kinase